MRAGIGPELIDNRRNLLAGCAIAIGNVTRKLVAISCIAALLHPGLAGASRRKRASRSQTREAKPQPEPGHRAKRAGRHGARGTAAEHLHVRRGDTLEAILAARGVSGAEARP